MISILTPAYIDSIEKLEWLNEAVTSVQAQTFKDWELILVDDASPMGITFNDPDERIRLVRTTYRVGPSLARNTAVALARHDALLPLDADDMLGSPDVLAKMLKLWEQDKTKIVYGDIQRYEQIEGQWRQGRVFDLPDYTFQKVLDLNGIIPVTAMHSLECHVKAGGWKSELEAGLEDVEYWIAAGKAGFCGQRLQGEIVLQYRKHESSRSAQLKFGNKRETEMRNAIRLMHQDVFEGRYPMGCCGGGRPYTPPENSLASMVSRPTTLDQYAQSEKVWVEYSGQREGSFGMVGEFTNIPYEINGPGHKLEVHVNDLSKFRRSGRGLDFVVGVMPPNGHMPEIVQQNGTSEYKAPEPQVAQILRLA